VTYIDALPARAMEAQPWQIRLRAAGLTQATLAKLLGRAEITLSKQIRGHFAGKVPRHVIAAIIAWELMDEAQRQTWINRVENDAANVGKKA
jgi:hypothetical protein